MTLIYVPTFSELFYTFFINRVRFFTFLSHPPKKCTSSCCYTFHISVFFFFMKKARLLLKMCPERSLCAFIICCLFNTEENQEHVVAQSVRLIPYTLTFGSSLKYSFYIRQHSFLQVWSFSGKCSWQEVVCSHLQSLF